MYCRYSSLLLFCAAVVFGTIRPCRVTICCLSTVSRLPTPERLHPTYPLPSHTVVLINLFATSTTIGTLFVCRANRPLCRPIDIPTPQAAREGLPRGGSSYTPTRAKILFDTITLTTALSAVRTERQHQATTVHPRYRTKPLCTQHTTTLTRINGRTPVLLISELRALASTHPFCVVVLSWVFAGGACCVLHCVVLQLKCSLRTHTVPSMASSILVAT